MLKHQILAAGCKQGVKSTAAELYKKIHTQKSPGHFVTTQVECKDQKVKPAKDRKLSLSNTTAGRPPAAAA